MPWRRRLRACSSRGHFSVSGQPMWDWLWTKLHWGTFFFLSTFHFWCQSLLSQWSTRSDRTGMLVAYVPRKSVSHHCRNRKNANELKIYSWCGRLIYACLWPPDSPGTEMSTEAATSATQGPPPHHLTLPPSACFKLWTGWTRKGSYSRTSHGHW